MVRLLQSKGMRSPSNGMIKKQMKKLNKGLTLRGFAGKIFSVVRKSPNKNKVMMTKQDILAELENAPRYNINYDRQRDGKTKEYVVALTERHPDHIKGYKFADGESCGIRRFNIDRINHMELVS